MMPRTARLLIATALTLAVGAAPLVADWCAASCEASRTAGAASAPACHHAASAGARVGSAAAPCGHGHHPMVVDGAATTARLSRASIVYAPVAADRAARRILRPMAALHVRARSATPPRSAPLALALSSALRI